VKKISSKGYGGKFKVPKVPKFSKLPRKTVVARFS